MNPVYTVGDYKVVVVSATYAVVRKTDGKVLYKTASVEDAIETAEDIEDRTAIAA